MTLIRGAAAAVELPPALRARPGQAAATRPMATSAAPRLGRPTERTPRLRRIGWQPGLTLAAAAALLLALVVAMTGGPTVEDAAAFAALPATTGAPSTDGARLMAAQDGVAFPRWDSEKLGWRATGMHTGDVDGRPATTVYYEKDGRTLAYTIVAGDALDGPEASRSLTVGGHDRRALRRRRRARGHVGARRPHVRADRPRRAGRQAGRARGLAASGRAAGLTPPPPPPRAAARGGARTGTRPAHRARLAAHADRVEGVHDAVAVEAVALRVAHAARGVRIAQRRVRVVERVLRRARMRQRRALEYPLTRAGLSLSPPWRWSSRPYWATMSAATPAACGAAIDVPCR